MGVEGGRGKEKKNRKGFVTHRVARGGEREGEKTKKREGTRRRQGGASKS